MTSALLAKPSKLDPAHRIVLTHNPDAALLLPKGFAALTLAGHTHGGQIALPFLRRVNTARILMTPYDGGTFVEDGCLLHVNRGIGTIFIPIRLGAPPEITVYSLSPA